MLGMLKKYALLIYKTCSDRLDPDEGGAPLSSQVTEGTYRISPFALLRMGDGDFIMETPLYPVRIGLAQKDTLALLDLFRKPTSIADTLSHFSHLGKEEVEKTLALLQQAKILTSEEPVL